MTRVVILAIGRFFFSTIILALPINSENRIKEALSEAQVEIQDAHESREMAPVNVAMRRLQRGPKRGKVLLQNIALARKAIKTWQARHKGADISLLEREIEGYRRNAEREIRGDSLTSELPQ